MDQRLFIYRALIYNKRTNTYTVARTLRDRQFSNKNDVMNDYNNWLTDLIRKLHEDETIINENLIGL